MPMRRNKETIMDHHAVLVLFKGIATLVEILLQRLMLIRNGPAQTTIGTAEHNPTEQRRDDRRRTSGTCSVMAVANTVIGDRIARIRVKTGASIDPKQHPQQDGVEKIFREAIVAFPEKLTLLM